MSINKAIIGDYNVICDVCGFKLKRSQCRKRWDGLLVCESDWEPRQPQDSVRGIPRRRRQIDLRPERRDRFIDGGPIEWDDGWQDVPSHTWDDFAVKWEDGSWIMWDGGTLPKDNGDILWDQGEPNMFDDDGNLISWDTSD